MGKEEKNYKYRVLKGSKGPKDIVEMGTETGRMTNVRVTPDTLDGFIHPSDNEDKAREIETAQDFAIELKKSLKPQELDVYTHIIECGYTQEETAAFLLVSRPRVTRIYAGIVKKVRKLKETYDW